VRLTSVQVRGGQGFPRAYWSGIPSETPYTRHGYIPGPRPLSAPEFRLLLTGNPVNDPRPRGPWVTGPPAAFPRAASTGARIPGGQGTDLGLPSTWQRPYRFTP
jgi:hypothetical protein